MLLMMFLICFNYSVLRNLKDSIALTSSGAAIIPFMKMGVLLPMAVLLTVVFTMLSNRYSQEKVFYLMMGLFLSYYALFAFVLYPLRDSIHPHETARYLSELFPSCKWMIALFENWSFTLFYAMSELWSVIIMQVIFWGFANEVTRVHEARRFYSVFSIGSNIAATFAGLGGVLFMSSEMTFGLEQTILAGSKELQEAIWQQKLNWIIALIIVGGIGVLALFSWMNKHVLTEPIFDELHSIKKESKRKNKQSLRDSFNYLKNSKYLLCIAALVVGYNLSINLVEVVWKDQVVKLYPLEEDYMWFTSCLTLFQGIISTITAFFMSRIISRFGWTFTALITPITMLITSIAFFTFFLFRESLGPIVTTLFGVTPLMIAVYIGAIQNCFSKAAKYSVFDATKEIAFIPLEHEVKLKGKAAIDGVGSRLGKSGGSLIHTGLLMLFYNLSQSGPYVAAVLLVAIMGWIMAVKALGNQFGELTEGEDSVRQPAPAEDPRPVLIEAKG